MCVFFLWPSSHCSFAVGDVVYLLKHESCMGVVATWEKGWKMEDHQNAVISGTHEDQSSFSPDIDTLTFYLVEATPDDSCNSSTGTRPGRRKKEYWVPKSVLGLWLFRVFLEFCMQKIIFFLAFSHFSLVTPGKSCRISWKTLTDLPWGTCVEPTAQHHRTAFSRHVPAWQTQAAGTPWVVRPASLGLCRTSWHVGGKTKKVMVLARRFFVFFFENRLWNHINTN